MHSIDSTIIAVAFPNFIKELHTNVLWAAWTISVFFIGVAMAMPLAGSLSDTFGRKRVFLISLALFTVSSVACGLAPNIYVLIGFRFLQGIGGSAFLPTASGIVSDAFPESRDRVIGLFTSIYPIGGIIGPNLGGWIVSKYSWRYIFYINLPIGLVLTGLIMVLLSDSKTFSRRHIDVAGASLMSGGLLFLMFALNIISESFSAVSISLATVSLVLSFTFFLFFLRQERKEAKPILDLTLLKSTPFLAANLLNMVLGAVIFGLFSFIPFYATSVHGLSTMMSGLILTPRSLGAIVASAGMSFLLRRYGYRWPMVLGFSIISFFGLGLPPVITLLEPSLGHGHNRIENVPRDTSMVFDIVDPDSGVAASSIEVLVDGVIAYQHGRWTSGWDGPGSTNVVIDNGYQLTIDPTTNFLYGADVVVVAHATDIAGNPTS